jgi:TolA-binding protein
MLPVAHFQRLKDDAGVKKSLAAARASYESVLARYPDAPVNLDVRRRLAEVCARQEDWKTAATVLAQIADRQPTGQGGLWALTQLAKIHETKLGDRRAAIEDYRRILARFPKAPFRPQVEAEIRRLGG